MIEPGLVSVTLRKCTAAEIVGLGRSCGLSAIEWGGDIHVPHGDCGLAAEVRERTQTAGLRVAAYGSYYRVGQSEAAGLPFGQVLETAVALGAPSIRVWAGTAGSDATAEDLRWRIIAELRRIGDLAMRASIAVTLEFHGGTLTDTNESASQLLVETDHPNILCQWQPHVGRPVEEGVEGLRAIAPRLGNLHVFHWWPTSSDRRPLAEGAGPWRRYLTEAATVPGHRYALLEFVERDDPEVVRRDAAILKTWLNELSL